MTLYLPNYGINVISNQRSFLPILGIDVVVHDLDTAEWEKSETTESAGNKANKKALKGLTSH